MAAVGKNVVTADWLFTATTIVIQPLTGFYLVYLADIPLTARLDILVDRLVPSRRGLLATGGVAANKNAAAGG